MSCPECGSEDVIKSPDGTYCKKCGLELDELPLSKIGKSRPQAIRLPGLVFSYSPKQEYYALKMALKKGRLSQEWEKRLGFKVSGMLRPEHKKKALELISNAAEKNASQLKSIMSGYDASWKKISNLFFIETENMLKLQWSSSYNCYLSMCLRYGMHDASRKMIIIQYDVGRLSNYVIAHELFQMQFRNYINRFFKEGFTEDDKDLSKIVAAFTLLTHPKIKKAFPEIKFSLDFFTEEHKPLVRRLWPYWKTLPPFKEFMISSYSELGTEKTWISY